MQTTKIQDQVECCVLDAGVLADYLSGTVNGASLAKTEATRIAHQLHDHLHTILKTLRKP